MAILSKDESENDLHQSVLKDIGARSEWVKKQTEIIKRERCYRTKKKTRPYPGAPNFVEPIISDAVREKTDQEVTMLLNAPLLAHAVPISPVDPALWSPLKSQIERAFDSYLRYVIRIRRKIEQAMHKKNLHGFAVVKQVRKFNRLLQQTIPDVEVCDVLDVVAPPDTSEIEDADRLTFILRPTERELRVNAKPVSEGGLGWQNVEEIIQKCKVDAEDKGRKEDWASGAETMQEISGVTTSRGCSYVVMWEIYTYATKDDVDAKAGIKEGERIRVVLSPDLPNMPAVKQPWRDPDTVERLSGDDEVKEMQAALAEGRGPVLYKNVRGAERPIPAAQCCFEESDPLFHSKRGGGELCMDDQIAATASTNAKATMVEYYQTPMLTGNARNPSAVSFEPGSVLPEGLNFATMPNVPSQFDFDINTRRAMAGRRMGAQSQYNYSTDMGARKLQKSATEYKGEEQRVVQVSSCSVDRFTEPLARVFQMLWDDLRRMKLVFPLIGIGAEGYEQAPEDMYTSKVLLIPAANSKTFNPDVQFERGVRLTGYCMDLAKAGVAVNLERVGRDTLTMLDARTTAGYILDPAQAGPQGQPPIYQTLDQIQQQIQQLAKAGSQTWQQVQKHEANFQGPGQQPQMPHAA